MKVSMCLRSTRVVVPHIKSSHGSHDLPTAIELDLDSLVKILIPRQYNCEMVSLRSHVLS